MAQALKKKSLIAIVKSPLTEIFGLAPRVAFITSVSVCLATAFATFWFFHSAPPTSITLVSGRKGSSFYKYAESYARILARSHVKVRLLESEGSIESLRLLSDPHSRADAALAIGGIASPEQISKVVSLGSVSHQPLLIFYRLPEPISVLSRFRGRRLEIGPEGSGTRKLSLSLLADNGILPGGNTALDGAEAETAVKKLLAGKADAVFLMGDSAPTQLIRELVHDQAIRLFSFAQADGYTRRFNYLNEMTLPRGAIDFGKDIPAKDASLVGPVVELLARPGLDPALCELLVEAAKEVHGGPGFFKRRGEFPSPEEHEFKLSPAAAHFYKSGKGFMSRHLPFWIASFVDRVLIAFLPLIVILIPALKAIPAALRLRINLMIYRWYRLLIKVERDVAGGVTPEQRAAVLAQLDELEREVNATRVPVPFATQFYELRGHIGFVRAQLKA